MTPLKFIRNYGLWAWLRHGFTWPRIIIIIEYESRYRIIDKGKLKKTKQKITIGIFEKHSS